MATPFRLLLSVFSVVPLVLCLLWPALARAPEQKPPEQQAPAPTEGVIRITVNLVQIDAIVTDSKGKQVTNLEPKDFEILQDGRPQKITNFSYVTLQPQTPSAPTARGGPALPPAMLRPEQVRRTIALVVDDLGLSFESTAFVRHALQKFVDTEMQPGDLVAVVRTSAGMGALQQFTSDKRLLDAAIDRVRWYPFGRSGVGAFPALGGDTASEPAEEHAVRQEIFSVGTLGALNYVVQGLRELPGRKSVVLLSDGFPIFSRENADLYHRTVEELNRLTDLANRSAVVLYAIDPRGLPALGFTAADNTSGLSPDGLSEELSKRRSDFFESQGGMQLLAEETGGFFVYNTNDIDSGLRSVLDDLSGYYLIGFKPDAATFEPGKAGPAYHKIKVRVKVPGLHIRSRTGFYGVPDQDARPAYRSRDEQLMAALTSPFASGDVHLKLTSLFSDSPAAGPFVRSLLHIDTHDLTFSDEPDGWKKTIVDVLAITFGDNGVPIDQSNRRYTIQLKGNQYQAALERGLLYTLDVPIRKPGPYQLRVALRDQSSEKVGSASQFIEVPETRKGRLALSGITLMRDPTSNATPDGLADAEASPAVRKFLPGSAMFYAYQIYNAHLDSHPRGSQLSAQTRVFHDGRQVFATKPAAVDSQGQKDLKRVATGGELRLGTKMAPGEYVLQVIVTDDFAKNKYRTATQWIDFEIVNPAQPPHAG